MIESKNLKTHIQDVLVSGADWGLYSPAHPSATSLQCVEKCLKMFKSEKSFKDVRRVK